MIGGKPLDASIYSPPSLGVDLEMNPSQRSCKLDFTMSGGQKTCTLDGFFKTTESEAWLVFAAVFKTVVGS